jgi:hypothetical protein
MLRQVAREIREATDEAGYTVDVALRQHRAFTASRTPSSTLERSLVLDAARRGASVGGAGVDEVSGGLDIITTSTDAIRRYRVKRVSLSATGELEAVCGIGSSLLVADPEGLIPEERWLLGFTTSDDHTIDRLLAAEIVDWRGTGPVRLLFGAIIDLEGELPPRGFRSSDEGLDGFDDEDGVGAADAV